MNEDNGIHEIMAEGIGQEPPIVGGPGHVFEQARRTRVRQRALTGAFSVVAVLGVAAGAVALGNAGRPANPAGVAAASVGSATTPTTLTTALAVTPTSPAAVVGSTPDTAAGTSPASAASSAPTTTPDKVAATTTKPAANAGSGCHVTSSTSMEGQGSKVPMDARSSLELVKDLLPNGFTGSHYVGQEGNFAGMAIDDGHGRVGIGVNTLQSGITDSGAVCTLPDGSRLYLHSLNGDKPTSGYPSLGEYVRRIWPNGDSIAIQVFNYWPDWGTTHPAHWVATATRPTLPLTNAQLLAMAADSRWGTTVPAAFAQQARQDLVPYTDLG